MYLVTSGGSEQHLWPKQQHAAGRPESKAAAAAYVAVIGRIKREEARSGFTEPASLDAFFKTVWA